MRVFTPTGSTLATARGSLFIPRRERYDSGTLNRQTKPAIMLIRRRCLFRWTEIAHLVVRGLVCSDLVVGEIFFNTPSGLIGPTHCSRTLLAAGADRGYPIAGFHRDSTAARRGTACRRYTASQPDCSSSDPRVRTHCLLRLDLKILRADLTLRYLSLFGFYVSRISCRQRLPRWWSTFPLRIAEAARLWSSATPTAALAAG